MSSLQLTDGRVVRAAAAPELKHRLHPGPRQLAMQRNDVDLMPMDGMERQTLVYKIAQVILLFLQLFILLISTFDIFFRALHKFAEIKLNNRKGKFKLQIS